LGCTRRKEGIDRQKLEVINSGQALAGKKFEKSLKWFTPLCPVTSMMKDSPQ